jgi:hypothetical protein
MKKLVFGNIVIVLLSAAGIGHGAEKDRPLQTLQFSAESAKQCELILPNPSEESYRKIGWRTSVLHGIVDAQKSDMPVMIVLMNGHPLGCT